MITHGREDKRDNGRKVALWPSCRKVVGKGFVEDLLTGAGSKKEGMVGEAYYNIDVSSSGGARSVKGEGDAVKKVGIAFLKGMGKVKSDPGGSDGNDVQRERTIGDSDKLFAHRETKSLLGGLELKVRADKGVVDPIVNVTVEDGKADLRVEAEAKTLTERRRNIKTISCAGIL